MVENYRQGNAEGLSLAFLTVWFIGDLANFFGAIWAGLVPTVIALAIYFCIADAVLITQVLYYDYVNSRKNSPREVVDGDAESPNQPLLGRGSSSDMGLPGSRRRSSVSQKRRDSTIAALALPVIPEEGGNTREWVKNTLCVLAVCAIGTAGWAIAWKAGAWKPTHGEPDKDTTQRNVGAEILGYLSAVAYLG